MASFRQKYPKLTLFFWFSVIGVAVGIGTLYALEALHPGILYTISHHGFSFFTDSAQEAINHEYVLGTIFGFLAGNILGFMGYGCYRLFHRDNLSESITEGVDSSHFIKHKAQGTPQPLTRGNIQRLESSILLGKQ